jgi:spore germination protein YaaH
LVAGLLWAAVAGAASPVPLTGYALAGAGPGAIAPQAASLSDVSVAGAAVRRDGASVTIEGPARRTLAASRAAGLPATLLVSNFDDRLGDVSSRTAAVLLRSAPNREAVSAALAAEVASSGWSGVTVDLERLDAGDRAGLVAFLSALREQLPAGSRLEIDVPASAAGCGELAPFDLSAIAANVDAVVLMAYDQHYEGGSPGPIAALPWVSRVLKVARCEVAAGDLRLGVAGYGYLWRRGHPTRSLSDAAARRLAGSRARWSAAAGEWHATLPRGGSLWWSDRRSIAARLGLAASEGLQGAALWRLGSADTL